MTTLQWGAGVNLPEFLYLDLTRQAAQPDELQARQIETLLNLGVSRVRFFVFHHAVAAGESLRRAALALDLLHEYGMEAILTLLDGRTEVFNPSPIAPCNSPDYFTSRLYREAAIPSVEIVVGALREHPALLGWELGDRLALRPPVSADDSRAFMTFVTEMGGTILNISPNAYVSIGTASVADVIPEADRDLFARRLYTLGTATLVSVAATTTLERAKASFDYAVGKELKLPFYAIDVALEPTLGAFRDECEIWRESDAFAMFADPDAAVASAGYRFPWTVEYDPARVVEANALAASFSPIRTKTYVVVDGPLGVRSAADIHSRRLSAMLPGVHIVVDADSRTEANGFIWWRHRDGWTAEKTSDGKQVYLREKIDMPTEPPGGPGSAGRIVIVKIDQEDIPVDVNLLPQRDALFSVSPVEASLIEWVQYFGNTTFAYRYGKSWNYDGYSQGLHGGFDFGGASGARIPVRAGVEGTVINPGLKFSPRRVDIRVGDYLIIFGHLLNETPRVAPGTRITPDTVIGTIATNVTFVPHVHVEVRYPSPSFHLIINPLLLMPEAIRSRLMAYPTDFYSHPLNWSRWATPYDQPVIRLGGRVIGPRARF